MEKYNEILRMLREKCGLTAPEVSALLKEKYGMDMNYRTLYNYENGKSSPDVNRFLALCEIYNSRDILKDFGFKAHDTGFDFEEIVLFEDEYSPDNWAMIKNFLALVPPKSKQ